MEPPRDGRYPPPVIAFSTKRWAELFSRERGREFLTQEDFFIKGFVSAPSAESIRLIAGNTFPTVQTLAAPADKLSHWVGMMTIASEAFEIETRLQSEEGLRGRLKQCALLFDKIAVYDLAHSLAVLGEAPISDELRWLMEAEIICQPEVDDRCVGDLPADYLQIADCAIKECSTMTGSASRAMTEFNHSARNSVDVKVLMTKTAQALKVGTWNSARGAALWFRTFDAAPVTAISPQPPPALVPGAERGEQSWASS